MTILKCVDTETTGLYGEIIEIGLAKVQFDEQGLKPLGGGIIIEKRFKPLSPIEIGAMAIHHITDEELEGCDSWKDSLSKYKAESGEYIAAFNMAFDERMLTPEFFSEGCKPFCIMKLAKELIPKKGNLKYSNTELFYYLGLHRKVGKPQGHAHSAAFDITMSLQILLELMERHQLSLEDCYNISGGSKAKHRSEENQNGNAQEDNGQVDKICRFNKHAGKTWDYLVKNERNYVTYLVNNDYVRDVKLRDYLRSLLAE